MDTITFSFCFGSDHPATIQDEGLNAQDNLTTAAGDKITNDAGEYIIIEGKPSPTGS